MKLSLRNKVLVNELEKKTKQKQNKIKQNKKTLTLGYSYSAFNVD